MVGSSSEEHQSMAAKRTAFSYGVGSTSWRAHSSSRLVATSAQGRVVAASEASESKEKAGLLSVWALSIELLEMLGEGEPKPFIVITAPSATNSNPRAQEGLFTLAKHIVPDRSAVDRKSFDELLRTSFEKYKVKTPGPWFHRVTLPRANADDLAFDLALEGINRAALFPDFYGVVMAMKDAARWQKDGRPGERRTRKHLESMTISWKTKVFLRTDATDKPGQH